MLYRPGHNTMSCYNLIIQVSLLSSFLRVLQFLDRLDNLKPITALSLVNVVRSSHSCSRSAGPGCKVF